MVSTQALQALTIMYSPLFHSLYSVTKKEMKLRTCSTLKRPREVSEERMIHGNGICLKGNYISYDTIWLLVANSRIRKYDWSVIPGYLNMPFTWVQEGQRFEVTHNLWTSLGMSCRPLRWCSSMAFFRVSRMLWELLRALLSVKYYALSRKTWICKGNL